MAKKKSVSKEETPMEVEVRSEDVQSEEANDSAPLDKTEILSTPDELTETGHEPEQDAGSTDRPLHNTGKVSVDGDYVDSQILTRLRTTALSLPEIYREAQIFGSQDLDVSALLQSNEHILIQNLVEILRMMDTWNPAAIPHLASDDARTVECVTRYVTHCFKAGKAAASDIVDEVARLDSGARAAVATFADRFSSTLINAVSQNRDPDIQMDVMPALTRLCVLLDARVLSRLLYDPAANVRIAVLRSYALRGSIDINDLSVALILLKDRDEQVNIAVMRMLARFAIHPEIVIPQIIPYVNEASAELRTEIMDVFRSYGGDAVDPLLLSLNDPREEVFEAVKAVISQMPQRYTDGLLKTFVSVRTRSLSRERVIRLLRHHQDAGRREEILHTLKTHLEPPGDDYPRWTPPDSDERFLPRAVDNDDVYQRILGDEEIPALSKLCTDDVLARLLGDARDVTRINAFNVIRHRGEVSPAILIEMLVWLKSATPALATAALDAYLTVEKNADNSIAVLLDAFERAESSEVKKKYFEVFTRHQTSVDALIRAYYRTPKKCSGFITKLLTLGPTEATFKGILAGLDRDKSAACVSETLAALIRTGYRFDERSIRPLLLQHIREPLAYGHYGFMVRCLSLKFLQMSLVKDESKDRGVVSQLQAFYKEVGNVELKAQTKTILKDLGEEIFDFDDEDDDFEDLREEEDE